MPSVAVVAKIDAFKQFTERPKEMNNKIGTYINNIIQIFENNKLTSNTTSTCPENVTWIKDNII